MKKLFSMNSNSWFFWITILCSFILVFLICFNLTTNTNEYERAERIIANVNGIIVTDYSEVIVMKNDKLITISGDSNYKTKVK